MSGGQTERVTQLLADWRAGRQEALNELTPLIYAELRRVAANYLRKEVPGHILTPTALVNEAYLKMIGREMPEWRNRSHFLAVAAQMMRQILVDYARQNRAAKRDFGRQVTLDEQAAMTTDGQVDLIGLNDALERLASWDARKARAIELRYFAGLDLEETAEVMGLTVATVRRDVALGQTFLRQELNTGIRAGNTGKE
jgi:RNA polymerase sigma factor (TIGR02999 family)